MTSVIPQVYLAIGHKIGVGEGLLVVQKRSSRTATHLGLGHFAVGRKVLVSRGAYNILSEVRVVAQTDEA